MLQAISRPKRQQVAEYWLVASALLVAIQCLIFYVLLPSGHQYSFHWQPYHAPITWWMSASIVLFPVAAIGSVVTAARSGGTWKLRIAMLLLAAGLLVAMLSVVFWYGLALGNGSGAVVANAQSDGTNYVLEYVVAGDPPATRYDLRECSVDYMWCRSVGGIYGHMEPVSAEPATIERNPDGTYSIVIGGEVRAVVEDGQIECRDTNTLFCID